MANDPYGQPQIVSKPNLKSGSSGKAIASLILGLASFFCAFITGIVAVILGIIAISDISKSMGRLRGQGMAITGIVLGSLGCLWTIPLLGIIMGMTLPAVQQVREAARQTMSMNSMRQMTLSQLNYEAAHGHFPPVGEGQNLSWRVHVLPFLDENELYEQFHLDEPWDSPHNLTLVDRMPAVFENPNFPLEPGKTVYLVPVTPASRSDADLPKAAFVSGEGGAAFDQFSDGASNTILIVEADPESAVTWTDPNGDWIYDPNDPMRSLGQLRPGVIVTAFVDGSTHSVDNGMPPQNFNAMITRDGGEPVQY